MMIHLKPFICAILFSTAFNQAHAANPFDGYKGMKCESMLKNLYENGPDKKESNKAKDYEALSHLKLIAANLAKIDEEKLDLDFKNSLLVGRAELIANGFSDAMIDMTRVERYEVNGKMFDVYIFPNGIVHHITSPLPKDRKHYLASVKECIPQQREMNCVDEEKNTRATGYCETIKAKTELDLTPNCPKKFVDEYIDDHNCLLEANRDSCNDLSLRPTATMGIAGGVAGILMAKKDTELLKKLKKWNELKEEHEVYSKKLNEAQEEIYKRLRPNKVSVLVEMARKYDEVDTKATRDMRFDIIDENFSGNDWPQTSIRSGAGKEAELELKKMYEKEISAEDIKKIRAVNDPVIKLLDDKTIKSLLVKGKPLRYGKLFDYSEVRGAMFGQGYIDAEKEVAAIKDRIVEKAYKKVYPNEKPLKYEELQAEFQKDPIRRYKLESELGELDSVGLKLKMKTINPEKKFFYEAADNYYSLSENSENAFRYQRNKLVGGGLRGGLIAAFGGAAQEAALKYKNMKELESCKKHFGLNDTELNFLNNDGVFLAGSQVKSEQFSDICSTMFLESPEETIENARKNFQGISPGLCKIITEEKERLEASLAKTFKDKVSGSCADKSVEAGDLKLFSSEPNGMTLNIKVDRPGEGVFIYEAPFAAGNSFPALNSVTVYRVDKDGKKTLANDYKNTFDQFYKTVVQSGQTIDLSSPKDSDIDAKTRMANRQRRYNAYMNQLYRNFSDSCKGYNNIECDVFSKAMNAGAFAEVVKSKCGDDAFDVKRPASESPKSSVQVK
jgi:hypothetical protein